jgi:hypothetical protein
MSQAATIAPARSTRPKPNLSSVDAKLRKQHPWFEDLAENAKTTAQLKRRSEERAEGPKLSEPDLKVLADRLEEIQRKLNPLLKERDAILERLLPHWGHTGIEEIQSPLGKTRITTSHQLCVDADVLQKALGETLWQKLSKRIIQSDLLLAEGKANEKVRKDIGKAVKVKQMSVSFTSPSSQTPRSGGTSSTQAEEAA